MRDDKDSTMLSFAKLSVLHFNENEWGVMARRLNSVFHLYNNSYDLKSGIKDVWESFSTEY